MMKTAFTSRAMFLCLLTAVIAAGIFRWPTLSAAQTQAKGGPSPEYAKLQQERIATLREAETVADTFLRQGTGSIDEVNRLNHELLEAQLSAASSEPERVHILTMELDAAKKEEKLASSRCKAGLTSTLVPLEAKAYRLGIQLRLSAASGK